MFWGLLVTDAHNVPEGWGRFFNELQLLFYQYSTGTGSKSESASHLAVLG